MENHLDEDEPKPFFARDHREGLPDPWLQNDISNADVVHMPNATIADDLVRLVRVGAGSRAFIVGTDAFSMTRAGSRWADELIDWLKRGCLIEYLLVDPPAKAIKRLREKVVANSVVGMAKLRVFRTKPHIELSPEALNYVKLWESFHFAGFENSTERQLWIEGCHRRGETIANDCVFYPDRALNRPGLFEVYKSQFEFVIGQYADCVFRSGDEKASGRRRISAPQRPETIPA